MNMKAFVHWFCVPRYTEMEVMKCAFHNCASTLRILDQTITLALFSQRSPSRPPPRTTDYYPSLTTFVSSFTSHHHQSVTSKATTNVHSSPSSSPSPSLFPSPSPPSASSHATTSNTASPSLAWASQRGYLPLSSAHAECQGM